jgi:cytosine deaminase
VTAGLIRDVLLPSGRGNLAFDDGRIVAAAANGAHELDGTMLVAVPRLIDSHLHLDTTLLGPRWYAHRTGSSVGERVRAEIDVLDSTKVEPTLVRAQRLVERAVVNGSTRLRSHVDISARLGLSRLQALLSIREVCADLVDITLVAFPQEGILRSPGTAELLDQALELGVEAVGGLDPVGFDGDMEAHLDTVFGLAVKHGCSIDIHLHDPNELGTATMREIALRAVALGLQGRVAVSHGYALGMVGPHELARTARTLADAHVTLITNVPGAEPRPPVDALLDLGVNVVFASDNVRDSWSPYGKADMLERVALAGYLFGWNSDVQLLSGLDRVTSAASHALGDEPALLQPGDPADFTLVTGDSLQEVIVTQPRERTVYRMGHVVASAGVIVRPGPLQLGPVT